MSTLWGYDELSLAEWEHLARLGGVDPHWLRLKWFIAGLLTGGRDASLPDAIPRHVTTAAIDLLVELSKWWDQEPPDRARLELVKTEADGPALVSPYMEAWNWIENNSASDSAVSLAKLLLSLSDRYRAPFSFRECARDLDGSGTELALRAVTHFANFDDDDELTEICERIRRAFPRLVELGAVSAAAQRDLRERWRRADAAHDRDSED